LSGEKHEPAGAASASMQVARDSAAPRTTGVKRVCLVELENDPGCTFRSAFAKRVRANPESQTAPPIGWKACAACGGFGRVRIHTDVLKGCPLCHGQGWFIVRAG